MSQVEQEDVILEQFERIGVSAAIVLLPVPCAHLVLHSSFREEMCQKLALQNTGHTFSSLGLYKGQARKTSKTSNGVSLTWLGLCLTWPDCRRLPLGQPFLAFTCTSRHVPCVGSGDCTAAERFGSQRALFSLERQSLSEQQNERCQHAATWSSSWEGGSHGLEQGDKSGKISMLPLDIGQ